jgi:hypothetical protein
MTARKTVAMPALIDPMILIEFQWRSSLSTSLSLGFSSVGTCSLGRLMVQPLNEISQTHQRRITS